MCLAHDSSPSSQGELGSSRSFEFVLKQGTRNKVDVKASPLANWLTEFLYEAPSIDWVTVILVQVELEPSCTFFSTADAGYRCTSLFFLGVATHACGNCMHAF
jgi:hypothetical protein